jgi:hypothetical protein
MDKDIVRGAGDTCRSRRAAASASTPNFGVPARENIDGVTYAGKTWLPHLAVGEVTAAPVIQLN